MMAAAYSPLREMRVRNDWPAGNEDVIASEAITAKLLNSANQSKFQLPMTTLEISEYIDAAISSNFSDYTSQSEEIETSEGGDGRFFGKVSATRYSGLPIGAHIFIAIGETAEGAQIVKVHRSETVKPNTDDLDVLLEKELGIKSSEE